MGSDIMTTKLATNYIYIHTYISGVHFFFIHQWIFTDATNKRSIQTSDWYVNCFSHIFYILTVLQQYCVLPYTKRSSHVQLTRLFFSRTVFFYQKVAISKPDDGFCTQIAEAQL